MNPYPEDVVEKSIKLFGDKFIKELGSPKNRTISYRRKMWDPRNKFMP